MPYVVISNTIIKEADILTDDGEFCVVALKEGNESVFRLRKSRVYRTWEEADAHVTNRWADNKKPKLKVIRQKPHQDYELEYYEAMIRRGSRRWYIG